MDSGAVPEAWAYEASKRPERSLVPSPEPAGVGTADVEALSSYLPRLAEHNDQAMGLFTRYVLAPILGRAGAGGAGREEWGRYFAQIFGTLRNSVDGLGAIAGDWALAVAVATLRASVELLTLRPWAGVLSPVGLTRSVRAWCPACIDADRRGGGPVYERLAWRLRASTYCLAHERPVALLTACPACGGESQSISTWGLPGCCTACGERLGSPLATIPDAPVTPWERFSSEEVRRLIASGRQPIDPAPAAADVGAGLTRARVAAGLTMQALADATGYTISVVSLWTAGRRRMSIDAALRVAFACGVHVDDLLLGHSGEPVETRGLRPPAVVRTTVDWASVEADLVAASTADDARSLTSVLRAHRADRGQAVLRYRELCRVIRDRHAEQARRERAARRAAATAAIEQATREIWAGGTYPGRDRAFRRAGVIDFRSDYLVEAWRATVRELGLV